MQAERLIAAERGISVQTERHTAVERSVSMQAERLIAAERGVSAQSAANKSFKAGRQCQMPAGQILNLSARYRAISSCISRAFSPATSAKLSDESA